MDELIHQIENGTADIPMFSRGEYDVTLNNINNGFSKIINLIRAVEPENFSTQSIVNLILVDGELRLFSSESPPNLHALPENAGILRAR